MMNPLKSYSVIYNEIQHLYFSLEIRKYIYFPVTGTAGTAHMKEAAK